MLGLLTATRRCQGRIMGIITQPKSKYNNFLCKMPLCFQFFAATTLHTKPNVTPSTQETNPPLEIVFFDLETTARQPDGKLHFLEFGAVVVCADTLAVKDRYNFLIRPSFDLKCIPKKMRDVDFSTTQHFPDVAPMIFNILDGRLWAGHNLKSFDARLIREAFRTTGHLPPVEIGIIDTLQLFRNWFPVPNNKLCTYAKYFNFEEQKHRSLPDALLARDILMRAAAVDFLRAKIPALPPPQGKTTLRDACMVSASPRSKNNTRR